MHMPCFTEEKARQMPRIGRIDLHEWRHLETERPAKQSRWRRLIHEADLPLQAKGSRDMPRKEIAAWLQPSHVSCVLLRPSLRMLLLLCSTSL